MWTSSHGRVPSAQVAPSPWPASVVLIASTPSVVGMNLAKTSTPCGKAVMGTSMPPNAMIAMLPTWLIAPMLATRTTSAVMIRP